jgi:hypothetical protein
MTDLLASIAKNGLRESLRMWWHGENVFSRKPSKTHPRYARLRRRTKAGHKTRPAVYKLTNTYEGQLGKTKTYQRVNDGAPLDDDEVVEYVTVKKGVLYGSRQRQRLTWKERQKKRALKTEQWAAVG